MSEQPPQPPLMAPPYRFAALTALGVFLLYVLTLAPTTQFWDASEYITAAHALGIPHPPGNPLFVLLAHVWGLLPLAADYGARVNLFAAAMSAASAGLWFLIAERWLRPIVPAVAGRRLAALAGTLVGATAFTVWNQSVANEKVYTVSLFSIALVLWLAIRWADHPPDRRPDRLLVLIAYLLALTATNHQMGLLAFPAVVALVAVTDVRTLVRPRLLVVALLAVAVATTVYLFLSIRAHLDPYLNQGSTTTWATLKDHLTRAQFGKPSVFDDPRFPAGPGNPGRSPTLFAQQILNYVQYFGWQWGHDLGDGARRALAVIFGFLGLVGARRHWKAERRQALTMGVLVFTLTIALVFYLNFRTGYSQSIGPAQVAREVRERDYFFVASFSAWGVWVGFGLVALAEWLRDALRAHGPTPARRWGGALAAPVLALALVPLGANRLSAPRTHETMARDFGRDMLQSADPYAVIVTGGDNDTFPLWYAQEVEGVRRDVTVLVTSLGNLNWYLRQMNQRPLATFDSSTAPALHRGRSWPKPATPWLAELYRGAGSDTLPEFTHVERPLSGRLGPLDVSLDPAQFPTPRYLTRVDLAVLGIVKQQLGRRPIYFSSTVGPYPDQLGLGPYLVTEGMLRRLVPGPVVASDSIRLSLVQRRYVNVPRTTRLAFEVYHGASAARQRARGWVDRASQNSLLPYIVTYDTVAEILRDSNPVQSNRALVLARAVLANTTYRFDLTPPTPTPTR